MQPSEQNLDALLAEVGWLRRFALHLTQDPGAAGDLAQDTLMAALGERSGGALRQPRAWLATVARRLAAAGRRRDRIRDDAAARNRSEATTISPGTDEMAERLELQRLVGEAMLELKEPYRGTLYAIYFQGARVEDIARESGVTAGAVRWRAFRARELVREILVRRSARSWDQLALQLVPIGVTFRSAADGAAPHWALSMTMKSVATGVAAGTLLALASNAVLPPEEATLPDVATIAVGDPGGAPTPPEPEGSSPGPTPGPPSSARTEAAPLRLPKGVRIARGWLRSAGSGVPQVAGATLRFTQGSAERRVDVEGNAWAIEGLAPGAWDLQVTATGFATLATEIEVPETSVLEQDIELVRTGSFALRVLDGEGRALPETLGSPIPIRDMLSVAVVGPGGADAGTWRGRTYRDSLDQIPADALGLVVLTQALPVTLELRYGDAVVDRCRIARLEDEIPWRVNVALLEQAERGVKFQRVAQGGAALPTSARLRPMSSGAAIPSRIELADAGATTGLRLPPGSYRLTLYGAKGQSQRHRFVVAAEDVDLGEIGLSAEESNR